MSRKTVLITGCSDGGLGAALAVAFHQNGWRVLATARNPKKMASLTAKGIETLPLDIQDETSLKSCVEQATKMTDSKLDMLINNAGGGYNAPVTDISIPEAKNLYDLNVWAVVATIKAFTPLLIKNPNGATIVNHTSCASVIALAFQGVYASSKAAMALLTEALRHEMQPFNIKVVDLKTGRVSSNFQQNAPALGTQVLPADSIFAPARDDVEMMLRGEAFTEGAMPAGVWARKVYADLTKSNPPHAVWRGAQALLVWVSLFVPSSWLDGERNKIVHMDVIGKKIQAARGKAKS